MGVTAGQAPLPPSPDIGKNNEISLRSKSDKKPGGQVGHKGHELKRALNEADYATPVPQVIYSS